jgi:hypothetical protein
VRVYKTKSLLSDLKEARKIAALRPFEVTITETLQMKISVNAKDKDAAEALVEKHWKNGDYLIDADHFVGVKFEASQEKPERRRGMDRE